LTKNKQKQGEKLIEEAKANSDDPTIHALAETCMAWAHTDLQAKTLSPLSLKSSEK